MKKKKFGPQVDNAGVAVICSRNAWTERLYFFGGFVPHFRLIGLFRTRSSIWQFFRFPGLELETWKEFSLWSRVQLLMIDGLNYAVIN